MLVTDRPDVDHANFCLAYIPNDNLGVTDTLCDDFTLDASNQNIADEYRDLGAFLEDCTIGPARGDSALCRDCFEALVRRSNDITLYHHVDADPPDDILEQFEGAEWVESEDTDISDKIQDITDEITE